MTRRFWAALVILAACSEPAADPAPPGPIEPPNCATVERFGNGASCSAAEGHLKACGAASGRMCAAARLCFDAPEYAFCGCDKDADCVGRATYINKARLGWGEAPLDAACMGGRCMGGP